MFQTKKTTFFTIAFIVAQCLPAATCNRARANEARSKGNPQQSFVRQQEETEQNSTTKLQSDSEIAKQVKRWLVVLSDPRSSLAQLTAAEQQLLKLGPEALPYLEDVNHSAGQVRLLRVRQQLEKQSEKLTAEPIQFDFEFNGDLDDAFEGIAERSGNSVKFEGLPATKIAIHQSDTHFWPMMDKLLDESNLDLILPTTSDGVWTFEPRPANRLSRESLSSYSGAFRIEPIRLTSQTDFRNPHLSQYRLELEVTWEPRIKPLLIRLPFDTVEAIQEEGEESKPRHEFPIASARESFTQPLSTRSITSRLAIPLLRSESTNNPPNQIRGTLQVEALGPRSPFEWSNLEDSALSAKPIKRGSVEVRLAGIEHTQDETTIAIEVAFDDAGESLESFRQWHKENPLVILDSQGKAFESISNTSDGQGLNRFRQLYRFENLPSLSDCVLRYKTPTAILQIDVPFTIKLP